MLTFTLTVVIAVLCLVSAAVGYWLGYRTGYTDGVEDALGSEDGQTKLSEGSGPYGLPEGAMVGGYTDNTIRSGTLPEGWEPGKDEWIDTKRTVDQSARPANIERAKQG